jgi:hypothetical protein
MVVRIRRLSIAATLLVITGVVAISAISWSAVDRTSFGDPAQSTVRNLELGSSKHISSHGISFDLDLTLAKDVTVKTIPASISGKPCDIWPEHPSFLLVGFPKRGQKHNVQSEIKVFSIADFRSAFESNIDDPGKADVSPGTAVWTRYFDEEVRVLKLLVAEKPTSNSVRAFLEKIRSEKGSCTEMPFLPMWEACQAFAAKVTYLDFENGKGVFFLTQWDLETEQITNENLEYAFQGITNDGKYYINGEFKVSAPGLKRGDEPEVLSWNESNYILDHDSSKYRAYSQPIIANLEALPNDKFQPNLELLDRLMGSLKVNVK